MIKVEKNIPEESIATPYGKYNEADVASPPSPIAVLVPPVPAKVDIIPVDTVTFRMRLLL